MGRTPNFFRFSSLNPPQGVCYSVGVNWWERPGAVRETAHQHTITGIASDGAGSLKFLEVVSR